MNGKIDLKEEAIIKSAEIYDNYRSIFKDASNYRSDILLMNITQSEEIFLESFSFPNDMCGMLCVDEFENTLVFNSNHSQERRNFTIGHELGHFFLHREKKSQFADRAKDMLDNTIGEFEIQANTFSAHILLPDEILSFFLMQYYHFYNIKNQLKISSSCLYWRLVNYSKGFLGLTEIDARFIVDDFIDYSKASIKNFAHHKFAIIYFLESNNFLEILDRRKKGIAPVKFIRNKNNEIIGIDKNHFCFLFV